MYKHFLCFATALLFNFFKCCDEIILSNVIATLRKNHLEITSLLMNLITKWNFKNRIVMCCKLDSVLQFNSLWRSLTVTFLLLYQDDLERSSFDQKAISSTLQQVYIFQSPISFCIIVKVLHQIVQRLL